MDSLFQVTIKPTLACTANCKNCTPRKDLHKELIYEKNLSFQEWEKVLSEAALLGVKNFTISGGEPTLYPHLVDLVKLGHGLGWQVNINSNGSMIKEKLAHELLDAGLNSIHISIYSSTSQIHDTIRNRAGLHAKAVEAVKIFARLAKQNKQFTLKTQTIISKDNYKDFADILKLHYRLGANASAVSYLEGDFEKTSLLSKEEIIFFRQNIIPKAIKFFMGQGINSEVTLKNIFSQNIASFDNWANGIYWSRERGCPHVKRGFVLILANGDVHPCNIVEYKHEPVLGNVFKDSLTDIWQNQIARDYRKNFHENCNLCPMNLHFGLEYIQVGKLRCYVSSIKRRIKSMGSKHKL
ncbi:MAG: radical SAM protein [Candidatus Omnitrophica bacterium]|nr:radical SAM protein [Candidatus Omnitrophota bacterium]